MFCRHIGHVDHDKSLASITMVLPKTGNVTAVEEIDKASEVKSQSRLLKSGLRYLKMMGKGGCFVAPRANTVSLCGGGYVKSVCVISGSMMIGALQQYSR
jgi:hypothetical protein